MRCIFDTNVFVSALLMPGSTPRRGVDKALRDGRILISEPVLSELSEVLARRQFRRYLELDDVRLFLTSLTREAEWVEVREQVKACRDPKDDMFLSLALAGDATDIVSGDADLLILNPFRGIRIVSPGAFLEQ